MYAAVSRVCLCLLVLIVRAFVAIQGFSSGLRPPFVSSTLLKAAHQDVSLLLRQCKRSGNYVAALEYAEQLEMGLAAASASPSPKSASITVTSIIQLYGESHQLGKALTVLKRMQSDWRVKPSEHHFGALIQAARRARQCDMAVELFQLMSTTYGLQRNTVVFNCMIMTAGESQRLDLVLELLATMDEERVPRDAYTYSAAISACEQLGQWQRAIELYEDMIARLRAASPASSSPAQKLKPSVVTLNTALQACVSGRQWRRALELLSQASRDKDLGLEPDAISFSLVISACGLASPPQLSVARRVFSALPEGRRDTGVCNAFLTALERGQPSRPAGKAVKEGEKEGQGEGRGEAEPWEEALDLLRRMADHGPNVLGDQAQPDTRSYTAVIVACGRAGQWRLCLSLFDEMAQRGVRRDKVAYNAVIVALQGAGQWERARGATKATEWAALWEAWSVWQRARQRELGKAVAWAAVWAPLLGRASGAARGRARARAMAASWGPKMEKPKEAARGLHWEPHWAAQRAPAWAGSSAPWWGREWEPRRAEQWARR